MKNHKTCENGNITSNVRLQDITNFNLIDYGKVHEKNYSLVLW